MALAAPSRSFALAAMASATDAGVEMLVDAVGRLQEEVALLELDRPVVDLDLRAHAERAAEIDLLRRQHDAMVVGELLQRVAGDAIDPRIADMEDVRRPPLQHHDVQACRHSRGRRPRRASRRVCECSHEFVAAMHALRRGLHRPGVRRAVVVRQEAFYRRFARHPADAAAADPVGQRHRDALRAERRLPGIMAPWKSWLDSLRPLSECWPIEIFRSRAIRCQSASASRRSCARFGAVRRCVA